MKLISSDISFAVRLEKLLSRKVRKGLGIIFGFIAAFLLIANALMLVSTYSLSVTFLYFVSTLLAFVSLMPGVDISNTNPIRIDLIPGTNFHINLAEGFHVWNGIMLLSLFSYLLIKIINVYIRSHHYRNQALYERGKLTGKSYYVKEVFSDDNFGDLIGSFFSGRAGVEICKRLNLSRNTVNNFLSKRINVVDYRSNKDIINITSLEDLVSYIIQNSDVSSFITENNISPKQFSDAAVFVEYYFSLKDNNDRFFGRKYLSYIISSPNLIFFKHSNFLKKYLRQVDLPNYYRNDNDVKLSLSKLEELYGRENKTNILLVGDDEYSTYNLIVQFYKQLTYNHRSSSTGDKYLYLLDVENFCIDNKTKDEFVFALNGLLGEISDLRNITLVISGFHTLIIHSKNLGVDLNEIFNNEKYLNLQILATTNTTKYYEKESSVLDINESFSLLNISSTNKNYLYDLISGTINQAEKEFDCTFSIFAINSIISFSEKYYVCGLFVDKIKDIIIEIGQYAANNNISIVSDLDVEKFIAYFPDVVVREEVGNKVNVVNIASGLKSEIYGQEYAISSIVGLIRDHNQEDKDKKPISFIIFGPDIHLKFELVKSLSRAISGSESNIIHFDMNEYIDDKAGDRLVRNNNLITRVNNPGTKIFVFTDFEKANINVQELFKHMCDTGNLVLSDGRTVSLKDSILVALSDIGSTEVYINLHNKGLHDRDFEAKVLDNIKNKNIIRSDVYNSFGDKILFKAANDEDLRKVTIHLLNRFAKKLSNEGVTLVVNDYLIDSVLKYGIDPSFGIAPIKKAISNIVEKRIREKMINGIIVKGNIIEFKEGEIV